MIKATAEIAEKTTPIARALESKDLALTGLDIDDVIRLDVIIFRVDEVIGSQVEIRGFSGTISKGSNNLNFTTLREFCKTTAKTYHI